MKRYSFLLGLLFVANSLFAQETLTIKDINLELIKCPAGSFMMGSPENEKGHRDNEIQHKVTITKPFYIGKYEITEKQFKSILKLDEYRSWKGDDYPIEDVSWGTARFFCDKLNRKYADQLPENYKFDLPTEAQWEYACRAGTTSALYNGKELEVGYGAEQNLDEIAWYENNSGRDFHPVGQKKPNAWGIYDMIGNVKEWCFDEYYEYTASDSIDPKINTIVVFDKDVECVIRGCSYNSSSGWCRSAYRDKEKPFGTNSVGIRVALVYKENEDLSKENTTPPNIKTWTLKDLNLEMVECPAGSFMMGSPDKELGRNDNENLHKVNLSKHFYIGKYEVTQRQYDSIMDSNPSGDVYDSFPVNFVSWERAKEFCDKLNAKYSASIPSGFKFELPTEAQWEYACRAGTDSALNNGKNFVNNDETDSKLLDEIAWFGDNSYGKVQSVGLKKPNAWGIYDMSGNVSEFCLDFYDSYSKKEVTDPLGRDSGVVGWDSHTLRGGSYEHADVHCRSASRTKLDPTQRSRGSFTGFRVALVWDGKTPISDSSSNGSVKEAPKAETSSNNSNSTTHQKNSASYDTKEYKPVQLKPIKTHPKVVVPEELELEP